MSLPLLCYINDSTTNLISHNQGYNTSDGINSGTWGRNFFSTTEYWDSYNDQLNREILIDKSLYHIILFYLDMRVSVYACVRIAYMHTKSLRWCVKRERRMVVCLLVYMYASEASLQCFGLPEIDEELKDFQW